METLIAENAISSNIGTPKFKNLPRKSNHMGDGEGHARRRIREGERERNGRNGEGGGRLKGEGRPVNKMLGCHSDLP